MLLQCRICSRTVEVMQGRDALFGLRVHSASQTSLSSMSILSRVAAGSGISFIEGSNVVFGLYTEWKLILKRLALFLSDVAHSVLK